MKESLLDTDTLSFYFKGNSKVVNNFQSYLDNYEQVNISIITYFEILGGLKFKNAIENDLTLVTNNEKHFLPIKDLRIENWTK